MARRIEMSLGPGPFPTAGDRGDDIDQTLDHAESGRSVKDIIDNAPLSDPPFRNFSCRFYETCLNLCASLNWSNFSCSGCDGTVNAKLVWRARQVQRQDGVAKLLCVLPPIELRRGGTDE